VADDFPAADSMDTTWFAVDRDGHVACFSSGEAGAVPSAAAEPGETGEALHRLAGSLPRGGVVYDLQGRFLPGGRPASFDHMGRLGFNYPVLMFLDSAEPLRDEIAAGLAVPVSATEGVAFILTGVSEAALHRLHDSGACRACSYRFNFGGTDAPAPGELGLYEYWHLTENWISGPYGRQQQPTQPLHVDQLPPALRNQLKQVCFDTLSFADSPYVQPVEHTPCESWESAWLDATGKRVRPLPGREDDYAETYGERQDLYGEFEVEPPPGAAGEGA
jgi:hypothetical protein